MKSKKILTLLVLTLLFTPIFTQAYSFSDLFNDIQDFFHDYLELTGAVIFQLTEKTTDIGTENLKEISPEHKLDLTKQKQCKDSDLFNYNKKGICKSKDRKFQDYCSPDNTMVMEFYCNEKTDNCAGTWYVCDGECIDGKCVNN